MISAPPNELSALSYSSAIAMKFPISRRGKLPAAAAYENHAVWRLSAAADNTALRKNLIIIYGYKIVTQSLYSCDMQ